MDKHQLNIYIFTLKNPVGFWLTKTFHLSPPKRKRQGRLLASLDWRRFLVESWNLTHEKGPSCWWKESGINSPVEGQVVYPIIYKVFHKSQVVVWDFWTINSPTKNPSTLPSIYFFNGLRVPMIWCLRNVLVHHFGTFRGVVSKGLLGTYYVVDNSRIT